MNEDEIKELLRELKQEQMRLSEAIATSAKVKKDGWDKIGATAPILSGILISAMAGYFTFSYNQQQLRLQEIQTIEKFIPHLMGNEKSKKAAILAMSSLTNTKLAARFASLFASEGTVSALKSIATTGDTKDRSIATEALQKALETIAQRYALENKSNEADALNESLEQKEQAASGEQGEALRASLAAKAADSAQTGTPAESDKDSSAPQTSQEPGAKPAKTTAQSPLPISDRPDSDASETNPSTM
jgi:hypothetical protein